jgi:hypothetical protein
MIHAKNDMVSPSRLVDACNKEILSPFALNVYASSPGSSLK